MFKESLIQWEHTVKLATMAVHIKTVQCNLVLEQRLERGHIKLTQKRSKYVQCDLKFDQHRNKNVGNSKTKFHSVATNIAIFRNVAGSRLCYR
jgi:hypothetical protein